MSNVSRNQYASYIVIPAKAGIYSDEKAWIPNQVLPVGRQVWDDKVAKLFGCDK